MDSRTIKHHFLRHFATEPSLLVRAPGRINLIGEHTDYNDGFVLPAAIDKAIWLAASHRTDDRFAFFAADLGEFFLSENATPVFQTEKTWANYLFGAVSETQPYGHKIGGLNLAFGGDVPLGAGLSSSAALESGMVFVLNELFGLRLSKMDIVRLAQRGENNFVGMKCGIMDMFASVMGQENHFVRLDCRSLEFEYFSFQSAPCASPPAPKGEPGGSAGSPLGAGGDAQGALCLLLLDSGVKHQLVDSEYNTRRAECEKGVEFLKKWDASIASLRDVSPAFLAKHQSELPVKVFARCLFVVEEIARVQSACKALQADDYRQVGKLMFDCHDGLNLKYEVCVPETNFLVEQARERALGARQMGGGFGGCTINLLKNSEIDDFVEDVARAYRRVFGLELKAYPVRLMGGVQRQEL